MRWLSEISVRRPVLASVLILGLAFLGLFSYFRLNIERWPNIDIPIVVVTVRDPGASPEEVETDVTDKIESAVNTISGIDTLSSTSAEGFAQILIQFVLDKNIEVAAQEVRDRISAIGADLPANLDPPSVTKIDPGVVPVITLAISADKPVRDITEYADKVIRPRLEGTAGVGQVEIIGGRARQINVWVDPSRLGAYALSTTAVIGALQTQNVQIPAGSVEPGDGAVDPAHAGPGVFRGRAPGRRHQQPCGCAHHARRRGAGRRRRGRSSDRREPQRHAGRVDADPQAVRHQYAECRTGCEDPPARAIERTLAPGYKIQIVRDQSVFVEASTGAVQEHLLVGALLAALVVMVFLWNWRSTIIAAIAIPTSLVSTFALLAWMGLTLNTITLLALALVVGIVIDDAIVVLENIYRFVHEKHVPPFQAAIDATREVGPAVTATTLSLIAVFLPLAFMGGIVGRFMSSFGWTMAFAIAVSLLVSFTLTPMLSARWIKPMAARAHAGEEEARGGWLYLALERWYRRLLERSLRRRWVVVC